MSEGPRIARAVTCASAFVGGGLLYAAAWLFVGAPAVSAAQQTNRAAPHCGGEAPKLTVTGSATVTVTPDVLRFSIDLHTTGPQAATALSANDAVTTSVVHALEAKGLTSSDVQTTDLTIQADYASTGGGVVTGYSVDDTVEVTVHDLGDAGSLIDTAVDIGGNAARVESVALSLTHPIRAQDRARSLAVHQAVAHARAMAKAAGERLGGICSVRDNSPTSTTTPIAYSATAGRAAPAAPTHGAPIEAGTQTVTGRVSLVFGLA